MTAGAGYEQNRRDDSVWFVHGIYNFGAFQLGASYGEVDNVAANSDRQNWNIMAVVPMGAITVKAGYGASKNDNTNADVSKKLGLGLDYALSKRTKIYTSFGRDTVKTSATGRTVYDIGVRHTF